MGRVVSLLAFIGLLGILTSIFLPTCDRLMTVREGVHVKAESDCKLLAMAALAYMNDYGELPGTGTVDSKSDVMDRLGGRSGRGKVYFENTGKLLSPHDKLYYITFDDDYDGKVILKSGPGGEVEGPVAVWSANPEGGYFTSWEK